MSWLPARKIASEFFVRGDVCNLDARRRATTASDQEFDILIYFPWHMACFKDCTLPWQARLKGQAAIMTNAKEGETMTAEYAWVRSSVAKLALAAAFVAFGSASAFAAAVTYEHVPERNTSFISHHTVGGPVLADDFDPAVGVSGGVTFVEWWGSRATSDSWEVTLHLGSGVGGPIPSVPAAIPAFTGGTKYFVTSAGVETAPGSGIFYFSAALPGDFFVTQQPNLEDDYWFSAANFSDGWTWALAGAGPTVGDEHWHAVSSVGSTPCPDGGPHCGAWSELEGQDLAFRISVTPAPEPMTLAVLGAALAGLGVARRRR